MLLGVRQHRESLLIARARIAHRVRQPPHRLDVLCETSGPESSTVSTSRSTPWKSGVSASTAMRRRAA